MLDSVDNFLSQDELNNKYQINCSFIDHLRIRQAIPGLWRHILVLQKIHRVQTCQKTPPYTVYNNDKIDPLHSPALDLLGTKLKVIYTGNLYKFEHQQWHQYGSRDGRISII